MINIRSGGFCAGMRSRWRGGAVGVSARSGVCAEGCRHCRARLAAARERGGVFGRREAAHPGSGACPGLVEAAQWQSVDRVQPCIQTSRHHDPVRRPRCCHWLGQDRPLSAPPSHRVPGFHEPPGWRSCRPGDPCDFGQSQYPQAQTRPLAGAAQERPFPFYADPCLLAQSGGGMVLHSLRPSPGRRELHRATPGAIRSTPLSRPIIKPLTPSSGPSKSYSRSIHELSTLTMQLGTSLALRCSAPLLPASASFVADTSPLDAVIAKTDPVGFVAMSAIGSNGNYPTSGTSALAYFSIESGSTPGVLINDYNPLTQAGIAIGNRRTAAQDTELEAFVAFMTDFTTSPSPDSPMITTLKKYCYSAP